MAGFVPNERVRFTLTNHNSKARSLFWSLAAVAMVWQVEGATDAVPFAPPIPDASPPPDAAT